MVKMYYDKDANFDLLKGKTVAIIGYGSQGHAHALNLKDSGANVIVGLYEGSKSKAKAEAAGLTVMNAADAAKAADIVMMLIPDEKQSATYKQDIAKNLKSGAALAFAHGFNIHFGIRHIGNQDHVEKTVHDVLINVENVYPVGRQYIGHLGNDTDFVLPYYRHYDTHNSILLSFNLPDCIYSACLVPVPQDNGLTGKKLCSCATFCRFFRRLLSLTFRMDCTLFSRLSVSQCCFFIVTYFGKICFSFTKVTISI